MKNRKHPSRVHHSVKNWHQRKVSTFHSVLIIGVTLALILFMFSILVANSLNQSSVLEGKPVNAGTYSYNTFSSIPYSQASSDLVDIYIPTRGVHPAVVLIHGGVWVGGDKSDMTSIAQFIAGQGFAVFNINYTLGVPNTTPDYPVGLNDSKTAVKWIRANTSKYSNTGKVGVIGSSAGANFAMMLASTGTANLDKVDAAVSWSGPLNFVLAYTDSQNPNNPQQSQAANVVNLITSNYTLCGYTACPSTWTSASPYNNFTSTTSPSYLFNSDNETMPLDQATSSAALLTSLGVKNREITMPGTLHAMAYATSIVPGTNLTVEQVSANFLHNILGQ